VLFVALDQTHHLRPFAAPGQKNKLVGISQNYLVIFSENIEHPTSNACDFLKTYFDALHACQQPLLMRACVRRAHCKKRRVQLVL
jgi:hypothetical protein